MNMKRCITPSLISIALLAIGTVHATTYHVDPINGSMSGDGSASNPWSTLEDVFANNKIESQEPATYPYEDGDPLIAKNSGAPMARRTSPSISRSPHRLAGRHSAPILLPRGRRATLS